VVGAAEGAEGAAAAAAAGAVAGTEATGSSGSRMAAVGPLDCLEREMQMPEDGAERRPRAASSRRPWWMRKSMPMMGKDTAARRKLQVNLWLASISGNSCRPQQAMAAPSEPSRRGPEGGEEEV
jgi:hypothetical protein